MDFLRKIFFISVAISSATTLLYPVTIDARIDSTNYTIWADVFSAGGDEGSSSTNYKLSDTIGEGTILSATTTSSGYGIKAGFRELYADHYITFSVSASSLSLGTLLNTTVKTGSHTMTVETNAAVGFTIAVSGGTLTSGSNTITAIGATAAASSPGTEQFGINLVANTAPSVGAGPSGTSPIGSVVDPYGTTNTFAYVSGSTVASSTQDINETVFTVSYIANISSATEIGGYSTTLTYSAVANQ